VQLSTFREKINYLSSVRVPYLDLKIIHESLQTELQTIYSQVIDESYFVYGKQVTEFENLFSNKLGVKYCYSTGNCTDALFIVLKMLGVSPDDEVIVPAMTWITDAEVVSNLGAKPVFVDVDSETCCLDPKAFEQAITPRTKAVIPVHLYGQMADMEAISEIATRHNIKVVEDCAQAHFASHNEKYAGSFGDAAVFSFYPTKNLGALGDAGALVTDNKELYTVCRKMANHGAADKHTHEFPGMNSRMDTLQAAVLSLKLNFIDEWNGQRNKIAKKYSESLSGCGDLVLPKTAGGNNHVFHIYNVLTSRRDELKSFLNENGIQTQIHYPKALPFTKAYLDFGLKPTDFPVSFKLQEEGLSLPIFPGMTDEQQEYVIDKVRAFFAR
jgi:dTDP-4-amino-4,6-dideoxygalactose transaminase